jgi:hypothetical protein
VRRDAAVGADLDHPAGGARPRNVAVSPGRCA